MPFEVQGDEPLDQVVNVRLSAREKALLQMDAQMAGLTMSTLVRRRYLGHRVESKSDLKVIGELRRLGGLLKKDYLDAQFRFAPEVIAASRAISLYMDSLSDREEDQGDEG